MMIDLIEQSSDDEFVIGSVGSVNSSGKVVNGLFRGLFFIEFVLSVETTFSSRGSEFFKEVIGQIVNVFKLLLSESRGKNLALHFSIKNISYLLVWKLSLMFLK